MFPLLGAVLIGRDGFGLLEMLRFMPFAPKAKAADAHLPPLDKSEAQALEIFTQANPAVIKPKTKSALRLKA